MSSSLPLLSSPGAEDTRNADANLSRNTWVFLGCVVITNLPLELLLDKVGRGLTWIQIWFPLCQGLQLFISPQASSSFIEYCKPSRELFYPCGCGFGSGVTAGQIGWGREALSILWPPLPHILPLLMVAGHVAQGLE